MKKPISPRTIGRTYYLKDLSHKERLTWQHALAVLEQVYQPITLMEKFGALLGLVPPILPQFFIVDRTGIGKRRTWSAAYFEEEDAVLITKRHLRDGVEPVVSSLLHEMAHRQSGNTDKTIGFEEQLTKLCGYLACRVYYETKKE